MTSRALQGLCGGVDEVRALRSHYPVREGHLAHGVAASAARAHGRACVVLLSSHYERYFHAINEEAIDWINSLRLSVDLLSTELRLQHSQRPIDELATTAWLKREEQLKTLLGTDGELWRTGGVTGDLDHSRLLIWMKAPYCKEVVRLYRQFGIPDIFSAATRKPHTRSRLWLNLSELVEKRNNIAHGDSQTEALPSQLTQYISSVQTFTASADRVFSKRLKSLSSTDTSPW